MTTSSKTCVDESETCFSSFQLKKNFILKTCEDSHFQEKKIHFVDEKMKSLILKKFVVFLFVFILFLTFQTTQSCRGGATEKESKK